MKLEGAKRPRNASMKPEEATKNVNAQEMWLCSPSGLALSAAKRHISYIVIVITYTENNLCIL